LLPKIQLSSFKGTSHCQHTYCNIPRKTFIKETESASPRKKRRKNTDDTNRTQTGRVFFVFLCFLCKEETQKKEKKAAGERIKREGDERFLKVPANRNKKLETPQKRQKKNRKK